MLKNDLTWKSADLHMDVNYVTTLISIAVTPLFFL
jgi:hypothetical protein